MNIKIAKICILLILLIVSSTFIFHQVSAKNNINPTEKTGNMVIAATQPIQEVLEGLSGKSGLQKTFGETEGTSGRDMLRNLVGSIVKFWKWMLGFIAVGMLVVAGFRVTTSSEEDTINTNKTIIIWVIIALIIILSLDTLVTKIFYGGETYEEFKVIKEEGKYGSPIFDDPKKLSRATRTGREEIIGIINWIKGIIGAISVLMIVLSGVRMIFAFGQEDLITKERMVFYWVGFGLVILAINEVLVNAFYNPQDEPGRTDFTEPATVGEAKQGIAEVAGLINWLLTFLAVLAIGVFVYGGFLLVVNWGYEEGVEKGKKTMTAAIIGLIIIFTSYAIVATMIGAKG